MSLYVVGIGPGNREGMTQEALAVLEKCGVIIGYTVYVRLVREYFPEKEYETTPMKCETERCRMALERASRGQDVAVVCSGDAGVYGMAGLLYQMKEKMMREAEEMSDGAKVRGMEGRFASDVEIRVICGVTAANSGAALLGAPLSHDFAVISLSDLLTPLDLIKRRLACAAMADMVICLYNPSSKKRADYLRMACDVVLEYQSPETVCGFVRNIGREGQETQVMSLSQLREAQTDMFTTVYIGNSATKLIDGKMVTPRGYRIE